jgi:hypothetical protein
MVKKRIEVFIDENGDPQIETIGYAGKECEKIQEALSQAIGKMITKKDKPEKLSHVTIQNQQKLYE